MSSIKKLTCDLCNYQIPLDKDQSTLVCPNCGNTFKLDHQFDTLEPVNLDDPVPQYPPIGQQPDTGFEISRMKPGTRIEVKEEKIFDPNIKPKEVKFSVMVGFNFNNYLKGVATIYKKLRLPILGIYGLYSIVILSLASVDELYSLLKFVYPFTSGTLVPDLGIVNLFYLFVAIPNLFIYLKIRDFHLRKKESTIIQEFARYILPILLISYLMNVLVSLALWLLSLVEIEENFWTALYFLLMTLAIYFPSRLIFVFHMLVTEKRSIVSGLQRAWSDAKDHQVFLYFSFYVFHFLSYSIYEMLQLFPRVHIDLDANPVFTVLIYLLVMVLVGLLEPISHSVLYFMRKETTREIVNGDIWRLV